MNRTNTKMKVEPRDIDLEKLKKLLEYGDAVTISKTTGYNHQYVLQVLSPNNEKFNAQIIIAAVDLVKDRAKIELDPDIADSLTKNGQSSVPNSDDD